MLPHMSMQREETLPCKVIRGDFLSSKTKNQEDGENPKGAVNRLVKLVMLEFVEQTRASEQSEKEDKNEAE